MVFYWRVISLQANLELANVLPLVEAMQTLIHRRNVFICDFIIVVKDFQSQLYTYYCSTMACPSKVINFSPYVN